ncbi:DUF6518 family protein [Svornostia abyssi]|uniref:DUF6518 family protein n=1 Tax=Svornostia abyssi TaxID=2898438 RepID=A0ABY5PCU2_9ACTN|nr:DUF6518 family protein [Parviterribacteraceae bacterium J379]
MVLVRHADKHPLAVVLLAAAGLGVALGLGAQHVGDLRPGLGWVGALGAPWLVTAFVAGALAPQARVAAIAGATALAVGTAAYYLAMVGMAGPGALGYAVVVGASWGMVALGIGAAFGAAGCLWRRRDDITGAVAAALPAGALMGEAVLLATIWDTRPALLIVGAQFGAGMTLPLLLVNRPALRVIAVGAAVAAALVFGTGEAVVRDTLRGVGWAGA